jgi:hypothetical protein
VCGCVVPEGERQREREREREKEKRLSEIDRRDREWSAKAEKARNKRDAPLEK